MTREQLAIYPEYEKSVRRLAASFGVRPEEMLLTNGVDDALRLLMEVFIEPGDSVLVPEPTFSMYRFFSQVAGARIVSVRYDEAMNFPLEETLRELARSPHILFIANPNNPTGRSWTRRRSRRYWMPRGAHWFWWTKRISTLPESRRCPGFGGGPI